MSISSIEHSKLSDISHSDESSGERSSFDGSNITPDLPSNKIENSFWGQTEIMPLTIENVKDNPKHSQVDCPAVPYYQKSNSELGNMLQIYDIDITTNFEADAPKWIAPMHLLYSMPEKRGNN